MELRLHLIHFLRLVVDTVKMLHLVVMVDLVAVFAALEQLVLVTQVDTHLLKVTTVQFLMKALVVVEVAVLEQLA
jgi:hypothetical protein